MQVSAGHIDVCASTLALRRHGTGSEVAELRRRPRELEGHSPGQGH